MLLFPLHPHSIKNLIFLVMNIPLPLLMLRQFDLNEERSKERDTQNSLLQMG